MRGMTNELLMLFFMSLQATQIINVNNFTLLL